MKNLLILALLGLFSPVSAQGAPIELPVRGIHFMPPDPGDIETFIAFIRGPLKDEGVNTLVLELNYAFAYRSRPELVGEDPIEREQLIAITEACREAGINLIPMINCLGHQSWAETTFALLSKYPEFDETPGLYPNNKDIYCRSYCPLHPEVHKVIFDLIDELLAITGSKDFHVGMDEVFLLGEDACPRCKGKNKAELFAGEVEKLRSHLSQKGARLWIWGDRFLDGRVTGIGEWEASFNDTAPALDMISKDIVINDWHYEFSAPTAGFFALKGFPVVLCPWRKTDVALSHLEQIIQIRRAANKEVAERALGILQTTWTSPANFMKAYSGTDEDVSQSAKESASCFKLLFAKIRELSR